MNKWRQFAGPALAAIVPLVFLLPFANKAYQIDDTFYLWVAQKIHETPLDYYGFDIAWGPTIRPAHEVNKNPPGVSYLWAAVGAFFGWDEIPMHVAAALIAALFGLGVYYLARRFTQHPLLAVLLAVISPGFMVSANTVMSDVPMMTAYVWAILLWLKGLENSRGEGRAGARPHAPDDVPREQVPPPGGWRGVPGSVSRIRALYLITAAILIAASTLTKYFGFTALPLLLVYTLLHERRANPRLLYLLIPIGIIALYQWHSTRLYGENMLISAADYAVGFSMDSGEVSLIYKTGVALAFLGGSFAALLFYAPLIWRWPVIVAGAFVVAVLTTWLLTYDQIDRLTIRGEVYLNWWFPLQIALWTVVGLFIVALAIKDLVRHRDAAAVFLFLWFAGTFLFSAYLNWAVNVRTMLPLAPALGIIVARRLELRFSAERLKQLRLHVVPLVLAAGLTGIVMYADFRLANAAPYAAQKFARDAAAYGRPYHYKGHWGFQYYMDAAGMPAFSPQEAEYEPGDRIVVPLNNTIAGIFNPQVARAYKSLSLEVPTLPWLTTMHRSTGAGFYMHNWGPLPFAFGPVPAEEYAVFELGNYLPPDAPIPTEPIPLEFYREDEARWSDWTR